MAILGSLRAAPGWTGSPELESSAIAVSLRWIEAQRELAPTSTRQRLVLAALGQLTEPLRFGNGLPIYDLRPGVRLRRRWGQCRHFPDGRRPEIQVRCVDGAPPAWRSTAGLVATLLHELAHLRYRGHGPRFWALNRRLVDQAAAMGIFRPEAGGLTERSQGDEKLAGSAAGVLAEAARARRRERAAANRAAAARWRTGDRVRILARGRLAGVEAQVIGVARSWVTVETSDKRRFRVLGPALGSLQDRLDA